MKLRYLIIKNFRGYKEETKIYFDNLTSFIGKNDAGKSTILEALEIFFNNKLITIDNQDLSIDAENKEIEISCGFTELPDSVIIDSSFKTSLKDEYLLKDDDLLEIKKIYNCTFSKPKEKVYIICNHPDVSPYNEIITKKLAELKKLATKMGIHESKYNASISSSIRKAIWDSCGTLTTKEQMIAVDKEDSKKIYDSIIKYLPLYSLFQSDRSSNDSDKEVADPMKLAIKQALTEVQNELEVVKSKVMDKAMQTAERTLLKLKEMDKELAEELNPIFKTEPKFDNIFSLSIQSDNGIPVNKRGSGIRRLILLNFFRAEAERKTLNLDNSNVIYAFEEPETSQHPKHQEILIESFKELSISKNSQVILTTHTPTLAGMLPLSSLRYVTKNNKGERIVNQGESEVYEEIANALGVLPTPFEKNTKAIVFVEGQGDVIFLRHIGRLLKENNDIPSTLEEQKFAFIPVGGCGNLKSWINLRLAEQFNIPWCILFDSDISTNEEQSNRDYIDGVKSQGIKAYLTRRREPENYFHKDCFDFPLTFEIDDKIDVKKSLGSMGKPGKKALENVFPNMTYEMLQETQKYIDDTGNIRYEFTEIFNDFLSLVKS
ncbi:AAA family ATPase [Macrococcoides caseolyticum]|uniref:AAA family ATPase n=1 Tax=Macrococcoides caseolyticum TaxID=69966 RepID=UPI001C603A3F|nr:AAA family ATPase [Macrococcus caseolyticus]QYA40425.1 AAA family ATPase [Macrococcus caseolyticus]